MENIHEEMPSSHNKVLCLIHLLSIFCDPTYGEAGTDNSNICNEDGWESRHYCFRLMLRKRRLGGGRCLANEFGVDPSLEQWAGFKLEMSGPGVRSGE